LQAPNRYAEKYRLQMMKQFEDELAEGKRNEVARVFKQLLPL